MNYTLDQNAAKAADVMYSKIEQKGAYVGAFTRAEPVISKGGAQGVDLSFKADSGEAADYLTIWTHSKTGDQLQGFKTLMAIMTCLRVKSLTSEVGEIEKYNSEIKKRETVSIPLYKTLMGKKIGLLLFMEEYPKTAGGTGWKPVISAAFDENGFTASEILNKKTAPELVEKMVSQLKDRPFVNNAQQAAPSGKPFIADNDDPFASMENDCPF